MSNHLRSDVAHRVLSLLDLTELSEDCSDDDVKRLCIRAAGGPVNVAAVCVWPSFVALASSHLAGTGIPIAAVANFPHGGTDVTGVLAEVRRAELDGADEIDVVMPYHAFLDGDRSMAETMLYEVRAAIDPPHRMKVILETGRLCEPALIADAAALAIDTGADFVKTSTGKIDVSATPESVAAILAVIKERGGTVGIKPSGGIRTLQQASSYLTLADEVMGSDWISPATFRFGASALYDDLLATISAATSSP